MTSEGRWLDASSTAVEQDMDCGLGCKRTRERGQQSGRPCASQLGPPSASSAVESVALYLHSPSSVLLQRKRRQTRRLSYCTLHPWPCDAFCGTHVEQHTIETGTTSDPIVIPRKTLLVGSRAVARSFVARITQLWTMERSFSRPKLYGHE